MPAEPLSPDDGKLIQVKTPLRAGRETGCMDAYTPQIPRFDAALIARHDIAGPRYTSYPTAPQFHEGFGEAQMRAAVRASNDDPIPRDLSLYVHIPYCFSPCFYCGCTRIISHDRSKADAYLEDLAREVELTAPLFDRDRRVVQLHLGGGTPNFLDAGQMDALLALLRRHFTLSDAQSREFGIELDPRSADAAYVRALADLGFNRLSVGIQDFDPDVQQAVNRHQGIAETAALLDAARTAGFRSSSVDLIYGLPRQTPQSFARTLDAVIALAPDRIAAYSYAHLPQLFKAQRQIETAELPDATGKLALLGLTVDRLTAAGYVYIGMDHFARPDDELARAQRAGTLQRNFQGYSTHAQCDILGLGVSSISRIGNTYHQNARDLPAYRAALDAGRLPVLRGIELSDDDRIRRAAINALMCQGELDTAAFGNRHGINFAQYFATALPRLHALQDDGLIEWQGTLLRISARGRLLTRQVAMVFDAYLAAAQPARYSRAI